MRNSKEKISLNDTHTHTQNRQIPGTRPVLG